MYDTSLSIKMDTAYSHMSGESAVVGLLPQGTGKSSFSSNNSPAGSPAKEYLQHCSDGNDSHNNNTKGSPAAEYRLDGGDRDVYEAECNENLAITQPKTPKSDKHLGILMNNIPQQKAPLNMHKHILLAIYTLCTTLSACIYFGWPGLSGMLFSSGAYQWLCDGNDNIPGADGKRYLCDAQDDAVQGLFTVAMPAHFCMAAVAGAMMDTIGPKVTASLGQLFNLTAWILLSQASENFNVYRLAFLFIGLGADTCFIPLLNLANLYPKWSGTVLAILGAANSLSFAVPQILQAIMGSTGSSFNTICILYCGVLVFCFLLSLIFVPFHPFKSDNEWTEFFKQKELAKIENAESGGAAANVEGATDKRVAHGMWGKMRGSAISLYRNVASCLPLIISYQYIVILIVFSAASVILSWFLVSGENMLTTQVNNFYGIITPASLFPTLAYGVLVDRIGVVPVLIINSLVGAVCYLTGVVPLTAMKYISAIAMTVYVSFYTSQLYCFVEKKFDSAHFGKLIGLASAIGGLISIVTEYLYSLTKVQLSGNFVYLSLVMVFLAFCNTGLLLSVFLGDRKRSKAHDCENNNKASE